MARVNSHRESQPLETLSGSAPTERGEQPPAENGGIPGLERPDHRAESGFVRGVLAEGQELSSNPLRFLFKGLRSTLFVVDVD
jgi:hypothetical protein